MSQCIKKYGLFTFLLLSSFIVSSCNLPQNHSVGHSLSSSRASDPPRHHKVQSLADLPEKKGEHVIYYTGFVCNYNPETKQPNWVSYSLTAEQVFITDNTPSIPRNFRPDPNLNLPQATNDDYRNSGWVRGHMARRQDMKWSDAAVLESDYFTNICAQNQTMNNGIWHRIENKVRSIAENNDTVYVVCGPVFKEGHYGVLGTSQIPIADYFFKTLLVVNNGKYSAIAFLCPNNDSQLSYRDVAVSINQIEKLTNFDFYSFLNNSIEETVEDYIDISLVENRH